MTIQTAQQLAERHREWCKKFRATGYVTNGQASDLADIVLAMQAEQQAGDNIELRIMALAHMACGGDARRQLTMQDAIRATVRGQQAARSEAPAGWQLVPIEPTPAMSAAGFSLSEAEHDPAGIYRAMLAAAPNPQDAEKAAGEPSA